METLGSISDSISIALGAVVLVVVFAIVFAFIAQCGMRSPRRWVAFTTPSWLYLSGGCGLTLLAAAITLVVWVGLGVWLGVGAGVFLAVGFGALLYFFAN